MTDGRATPLRVAVMIPTHNQAAYLAQAVRSALAQTYPFVEVLVGDDASSDDTAALMQRFAPDPRVRYIRHAQNLGRVGNYRHLLQASAGADFVVNLDGDDFFIDPDFVRDAVNAVCANSDAVIVAARARWVWNGRERCSGAAGTRVLSGVQVLARMPASRYHFQHLATLYRRDLACSMDFYRNTSTSSDWESLYRLACQGKVVFLDRVVGEWRQHAGNVSATVSSAGVVDSLMIWQPVYAAARAAGMASWLAAWRCAGCEWRMLGGYAARQPASAGALLNAYVRAAGRRAWLGVLWPADLTRVALILMRAQLWRVMPRSGAK